MVRLGNILLGAQQLPLMRSTPEILYHSSLLVLGAHAEIHPELKNLPEHYLDPPVLGEYRCSQALTHVYRDWDNSVL